MIKFRVVWNTCDKDYDLCARCLSTRQSFASSVFALMSTNTTTHNSIRASGAASHVSMRWIISARDDLVWFIGSVLSSYALYAFYVSGILPLVPMVAAWAILLDAPHLFGTFSRTYFDREERQSRQRLLLGSLLFFLVGPVMVVAGAGLFSSFSPRYGLTTISSNSTTVLWCSTKRRTTILPL